MSHDPFAGSRRNARRRHTTTGTVEGTEPAPGDSDEMIAWIDAAQDPDERHQRAKLVIQSEKATAEPRPDVLAAAKATARAPAATPPDTSGENHEPASVPDVEVPEKAREIVTWIREATSPEDTRHRAEAAHAAEIARNGKVRPSVQAEIDKAL